MLIIYIFTQCVTKTYEIVYIFTKSLFSQMFSQFRNLGWIDQLIQAKLPI